MLADQGSTLAKRMDASPLEVQVLLVMTAGKAEANEDESRRHRLGVPQAMSLNRVIVWRKSCYVSCTYLGAILEADWVEAVSHILL